MNGDRRAAGPPFRPHPLLGGFHRMTIGSALPRRGPPVSERRAFVVDDETTVTALCSWQPSGRAPTLVVCHGLTGHADRPYMRGLGATAFAAGFDVVIVCCSNQSAENFWQARLEQTVQQVTGTAGAAVLAVHEDWNGGAGNGLGTLYAFHADDTDSIGWPMWGGGPGHNG